MAAWDVLSSFNYAMCNLKRDLDNAPIFEIDSVVNGYTLYFPVATFNMICHVLPKDDEDVMYVAIYPSKTEMPEGIYGTGVWGNYWYCLHNGEGLHG